MVVQGGEIAVGEELQELCRVAPIWSGTELVLSIFQVRMQRTLDFHAYLLQPRIRQRLIRPDQENGMGLPLSVKRTAPALSVSKNPMVASTALPDFRQNRLSRKHCAPGVAEIHLLGKSHEHAEKGEEVVRIGKERLRLGLHSVSRDQFLISARCATGQQHGFLPIEPSQLRRQTTSRNPVFRSRNLQAEMDRRAALTSPPTPGDGRRDFNTCAIRNFLD